MLNNNNAINLVVVLGPTASGKTKLGVAIARLIGGEIISADSRQVFRSMDIGTGKDIVDYGDLPYHLIDIRDPSEEFSVFHFQRECLQAMADIQARNRVPVLVGGTGLYLESILNGYQLVEVPENQALRTELAGLPLESLCSRLVQAASSTHNTTDMLDRERLIRAIEIAEHAQRNKPEPLPEIRPLIFGIRWQRTTLRKRITDRLKERLAAGMVDEVKKLHDAGIPWERLDYFGLEYRFVARHLRGELNRNDLFQKLNSAIHDFAKRQDNWFRRMERNGTVINWLDGEGDPIAQALAILEQSPLDPHPC
ncbi:tRNA (adenosine(37)-N6)-dimethylallyltransferase MiaA [Geobacter pelophilus]|uniref:tRNA dimethylallyltransferase n=1 Tax=Geoanaerobacter pelophilus TaxID=60036 RepID=A0AAW4L4U0_9BACT|nr:tRNA (adenosine(37)-N6)-dimethylallyltransferase MiaA [Geoanaerobacter pelophilus]